MTTSSYTESPVRSKELLKNAIAFMGTHQLSANPVNYTVCYEYLLGNQLVLKQAIENAISDQVPLTDAKMEKWFETLITGYDVISLKQTQNDLKVFSHDSQVQQTKPSGTSINSPTRCSRVSQK